MRSHELPEDRALAASLHHRRVRRMLLVSSATLWLASLAWALFFGWRGDWVIVVSDGFLGLLGLYGGQLAQQGRLRRGALLLLPGLLLVLLGQALFLDLPTPAAPRTVHLYLLPMAIFAIVVFRDDNRLLRQGLPLCLLLLFVFLSATQGGIDQRFQLPDSLRVPGSWINAVTATAILFVLLHLLQADLTETTVLERELREGLAREQFVLLFQPQHGQSGELVGAEVLLRWRHPLRGWIPPAHFIPLAEQTGLIRPLGHLVLQQACHQLAEWARQPHKAHWSLAVNVSAVQLHQPDFVASVKAALDAAGAPAVRLKLELTESLLLREVDRVIAKMQSLQALGVRFSLDDFGTGYSSLSYLRRLPLEQLKIDQSFVAELPHNESDVAIVRAVLALGQSLGLTVIAEGVETVEQWRHLCQAGCELFQGYWFSPPLELSEFESYALAGPRPDRPGVAVQPNAG